MQLSKILNDLFGENYHPSLPLKEKSYLKIGGIAEHAVFINDTDSLLALENFLQQGIPYRVLGLCTNVLFASSKLKGVTILFDMKPKRNARRPVQLEQSHKNKISAGGGSSNLHADLLTPHLIKKDNERKRECLSKQRQLDDLPQGQLVSLPAGMPLARAVRFIHRNFLTGLEFAIGIPGSVGGAIVMNAGASGYETKDFLREVLLYREGRFQNISSDRLELSYRNSNIGTDEIVIAGKFAFAKVNAESLKPYKEQCLKHLSDRREKQPLSLPSLGSTFKNPTGLFAAKLIEDLGLKGYRVGGVSMSTKHANFLYNHGDGTAKDALHLIDKIKNCVFEKTGVELKLEIKVIR